MRKQRGVFNQVLSFTLVIILSLSVTNVYSESNKQNTLRNKEKLQKQQEIETVFKKPFYEFTDAQREAKRRKNIHDTTWTRYIHGKHFNFKYDYFRFTYLSFEDLVQNSNGNFVYAPSAVFISLYDLYNLMFDSSDAGMQFLKIFDSAPRRERADFVINRMEADGYLINSLIALPKTAYIEKEKIPKDYTTDLYRINKADKNIENAKKNWMTLWSKGEIPVDKISLSETIQENEIHLLSSLYKQPLWRDNYFKIRKESFQSLNGKTKEIDFIYNDTEQYFGYYRAKDFEAVRVPLKESNYLVLVMPTENNTVERIATLYDFLLLNEHPWEKCKVKLSFPKITQGTVLDFTPTLKNLGGEDIITPNNSFGNFLDIPNAKIAAIEQVNYLKFDEKNFDKNFEPYYNMEVNTAAQLSNKKVEIKFNKPFYYFVHRDGYMAFMGVYRNAP